MVYATMKLIQSTPSLDSTMVRIRGTDYYDEEAAVPIIDFVSVSSVQSSSSLALGHLQLLLDWAIQHLVGDHHRHATAATNTDTQMMSLRCQLIRQTMHLITMNWTLHLRRYDHAIHVMEEIQSMMDYQMDRLETLPLYIQALVHFSFLQSCQKHMHKISSALGH